jgi:N-acetylglutamate synthase-like GNAT family acetyltransferase
VVFEINELKMATIKRARSEHIPAVNELARMYGLPDVPESLINNHDIALVAVQDGRTVGFIWCGLMGRKEIGYVDFYLVASDVAKSGVGRALGLEVIRRAKNMGVRTLIGSIRRDEWHEKSAMNALKCAFGADPIPHTSLMGDVEHMAKELRL